MILKTQSNRKLAYKFSTLILLFFPFFIPGVPYPATFDLPTNWSDTTFKLSWRVNCSINAPIINYQLEFKEVPHGQWVVINIPAEIDYDSFQKHHYKNRRRKSKKNKSDIVQFQQSYTIKGLTKGSSYKVCHNIQGVTKNGPPSVKFTLFYIVFASNF